MSINIDELSEEELIDLNRKIVERLRLMHQVHAHQEMFKFKIGDKVTFRPTGRPPLTGMLTRFNKKTVTIITEAGGHWNVAPSFIELAETPKAERKTFLQLLRNKA